MFELLILRPNSIYVFLSGVFVAVATNALSTAVFGADLPRNANNLYVVTAISFCAAIGWFWLGERTADLRRTAERDAVGFSEDQDSNLRKAARLLAEQDAFRTAVLFLVTIALSCMWPFAARI